MSETTEIVGKINALGTDYGRKGGEYGVKINGVLYLTDGPTFRKACDVFDGLVIAEVCGKRLVAIHAAKAVKVTP